MEQDQVSAEEKEEELRATVDNGPSYDRKQRLGMEEGKDMTQDPMPSLCSSMPFLALSRHS